MHLSFLNGFWYYFSWWFVFVAYIWFKVFYLIEDSVVRMIIKQGLNHAAETGCNAVPSLHQTAAPVTGRAAQSTAMEVVQQALTPKSAR